ncbi:hypothetical protein ACIF70_40610 [Actinacidiphila glaucinigra]|uniref:hypothetical protein n=1 Tax=Actinacidiphila glaucinigra TaxID=235986 RepID=UPI0037C7D80B
MIENQSTVPPPRPDNSDSLASPMPSPSQGTSVIDQLIQAQTGKRQGNATNYLRAASHLDRAFRDAVIEELVENPHRIPPPSYGIDLAAVLKECLAARRWAAGRSLALLVVTPLLMALLIDPWGALLAVATVLWVRVYLSIARAATRMLVRFAARFSDPAAARWVRRVAGFVWLGALVYSAFSIIGNLWFLLETPQDFCGFNALDDGQCPASETNSPLWAALAVLLTWILVAGYDRYHLLKTLYKITTEKLSVRPDGKGSMAARYQKLRQQQADPDVVYSDYAPFVGAGIELNHWSFAIELVPSDDQLATPADTSSPSAPPSQKTSASLTAPAVHAHLRHHLLRLGQNDTAATYPGDQLHGITVADHVFKSGLRIGPAGDWSGTGPGTAFARMAPYAAQAAAKQFDLSPGHSGTSTWWVDTLDLAAEERLRHYLAVRVGSWGEEVVLTVFSRVQMQGDILFLENRAFVLPPIARAYHSVDTVMPPSGAGDWFGLAWAALRSSLVLVYSAASEPYVSVRTIIRAKRARKWYERMCETNRLVDHGPQRSVREIGAELEYQQLFQEMDVQRFLKIITTRTLTAVRECLRDHGYRTDEYEARQNVVINNGVQVHGNVEGNVQTGTHARATYQPVTAPQPRIGSHPHD